MSKNKECSGRNVRGQPLILADCHEEFGFQIGG